MIHAGNCFSRVVGHRQGRRSPHQLLVWFRLRLRLRLRLQVQLRLRLWLRLRLRLRHQTTTGQFTITLMLNQTCRPCLRLVSFAVAAGSHQGDDLTCWRSHATLWPVVQRVRLCDR